MDSLFNTIHSLQNCHSVRSFSSFPKRLIFAKKSDQGGGKNDGNEKDKDDKDEKVKDEKVTVANIREVLKRLSRESKITSTEASEAEKVLRTGSVDERKKLIELAQKALDNKLGTGEFSKFLKDFKERKEALGEGEVIGVKNDILKKLDLNFLTVDRVANSLQGGKKQKNQHAAEKMREIQRDFKKLHLRAHEASQPVEAKLKELAEDKKIAPELSEQLLNLDFNDQEDREIWENQTKNITDARIKKSLEDVKDLKIIQAKKDKEIEAEMKEKQKKFYEYSTEIVDDIYTKAGQDKAKERLERTAGINLSENQALIIRHFEETKEGYKESDREAIIKKVYYEDVEIKDDKGQILKRLPSIDPMIRIELLDPLTHAVSERKFTPKEFKRWVRENSVTEKIHTQAELDRALREKIRAGDYIEYHLLLDPDEDMYDSEEKTILVKKIDESVNEVVLSEPVIIDPGSSEKKTTLSFGEFAKWYKRNEAVPPITKVKKLQDDLTVLNHVWNQQYERHPKLYPPIEAKVGEVLMWEDNTDRNFVIKKIDDKKIKIANTKNYKQTEYTLAGFLRWVKKNKVEKLDPAAEAAKAVSRMENEGEKAKAQEKFQQKFEAENAERVKSTEEQPFLEEDVSNNGNGELPTGQNGNITKEDPHGHPPASAGELKQDDFNINYAEQETLTPASYLRKLWDDTTFLTLGDLWEMGNTIFEFAKRKVERKQKGRMGKVGEDMMMNVGHWFGGAAGKMFEELGGEFKGVGLHAEHEEVNHHVEHMKSMDVPSIEHELHQAPNLDIFKAAITSLTDRGEMRWDDENFIECLNRLTHNQPKAVSKYRYMEDLETVLDEIYGKGTFKDFRSKQDSSYTGQKNGFEEQAKRLENDPDRNGGLKGALQKLLYKHLKGEGYVSAAQYEEFLHFAIASGKLSFEDKIFFILMGLGAPGKGHHGPGKTLLHVDRIAVMEGSLLNNFPFLDYFAAAKHFQYDQHGKIIPETKMVDGKKEIVWLDEAKKIPKPLEGKASLNNYKKWIHDYCFEDLSAINNSKECKWGEKLTNFIQQGLIWNRSVRVRIEKSGRDPGGNWDHDDMHMLAPMLGENMIEQLLIKSQGGAKQVSVPGMKNALVGFNNFAAIKLKMIEQHKGKPEKLREDVRDLTNVLRSYVRFDAVLNGRSHHNHENYMRFGTQELNSKAGVDDSRDIINHQKELRKFIGDLSKRLGVEKIWEERVMNNKNPSDQEKAVKEFGLILEDKMAERKTEELTEMFTQIQAENAKSRINIRGIEDEPVDKEKLQGIEEEDPHRLIPYIPPEIRLMALEVKRKKEALTEQKKSKNLDEEQRRRRVSEIIKQIEEEKYHFQPDDDDFLKAELDELNRPPEKKDQGTPTPEAA